MWCKSCELEVAGEHCPVCGAETLERVPEAVFYCDACGVPLVLSVSTHDAHCPLCGGSARYLASDLRPVFPEERRLVELLLGRAAHSLGGASVWAQDSRYYIDGRAQQVSRRTYETCDTDRLTAALKAEVASVNAGATGDGLGAEAAGGYAEFTDQMERFAAANRAHLAEIVAEAQEFVRREAASYPMENIVLSFSGGKDSTVTADIVTKALSEPSLVHIFGDTTLEFPLTLEYAARFRAAHPQAIFQTARNREQDFMEICAEIGPPARMMRWCCSMFKTGPITRVIGSLYQSQQILTFYGIRRYESVSRSKYSRVTKNTESVKIQQQTVAAPIFDWHDIDVWLYILAEGIDFNAAYRLGYDRVGCYCCPNNNTRAQFLSRIYMPERSRAWRDFLVDFAKRIGKSDAEVYVDSGKWKARQGGNGLVAAQSVKLQYTNCTAEEHAKIYRLYRPYDDELINMFVPFGRVSRTLGQKLLKETLILDVRTNVPIMSLQPFSQDGYEHAIKIRTLNVSAKAHEDLQRMAGYQVRKFNACRRCLKCESLCRAGAISIIGDSYYIDEDKCVHCRRCVNAKFLAGGCMMEKYLRTK